MRANVTGYNVDDQMRRYDRQYFDPVADINESKRYSLIYLICPSGQKCIIEA